METIRFEWDNKKSAINKKKHGVSFSEAITVFYDSQALIIEDPDHSIGEERFIAIGFSNLAHMLVVCHCYRHNDEVIRIISARQATNKESVQYFMLNGGA